MNAIHASSQDLTIQSVWYPKKVRPNEKFSIDVAFICSGTSGWAKAKMFWNGQEVKVSNEIWFGPLGKDPNKVENVTFSDVELTSSKTPYNFEIAMFWRTLAGEFKQDSRQIAILAVEIKLNVEFLPKSVSINQNFLLRCTVTNEGNDVAYAVVSEITEYGGLSPKGEMKKTIGNLDPGASKQVFFNLSCPFAVFGGNRKLTLTLKYQDWAGKESMRPFELSIVVEIPEETYTNILIPWTIIAIVVVIFVFSVADRLEIGPIKFRRGR